MFYFIYFYDNKENKKKEKRKKKDKTKYIYIYIKSIKCVNLFFSCTRPLNIAKSENWSWSNGIRFIENLIFFLLNFRPVSRIRTRVNKLKCFARFKFSNIFDFGAVYNWLLVYRIDSTDWLHQLNLNCGW